MRKLNDEQSEVAGSDRPVTVGGDETSGAKTEVKQSGEGVPAGRVVKAPFKPAGTSITLWGCGRRDGKDVNNSMGLVEAYRLILGL